MGPAEGGAVNYSIIAMRHVSFSASGGSLLCQAITKGTLGAGATAAKQRASGPALYDGVGIHHKLQLPGWVESVFPPTWLVQY